MRWSPAHRARGAVREAAGADEAQPSPQRWSSSCTAAGQRRPQATLFSRAECCRAVQGQSNSAAPRDAAGLSSAGPRDGVCMNCRNIGPLGALSRTGVALCGRVRRLCAVAGGSAALAEAARFSAPLHNNGGLLIGQPRRSLIRAGGCACRVGVSAARTN